MNNYYDKMPITFEEHLNTMEARDTDYSIFKETLDAGVNNILNAAEIQYPIKWHSCLSDDLPELGKDVLLIYSDGTMDVGHLFAPKFLGGDKSIWIAAHGGPLFWTHLPRPPKELEL